jgi:hypothetical protein
LQRGIIDSGLETAQAAMEKMENKERFPLSHGSGDR